jgi:hypothetical protein
MSFQEEDMAAPQCNARADAIAAAHRGSSHRKRDTNVRTGCAAGYTRGEQRFLVTRRVSRN